MTKLSENKYSKKHTAFLKDNKFLADAASLIDSERPNFAPFRKEYGQGAASAVKAARDFVHADPEMRRTIRSEVKSKPNISVKTVEAIMNHIGKVVFFLDWFCVIGPAYSASGRLPRQRSMYRDF